VSEKDSLWRAEKGNLIERWERAISEAQKEKKEKRGVTIKMEKKG